MSLPVISVAQMREWEQATWATGRTEAEVVRRVGQAVALRALQLTRSGNLILLLAGKGHNGDDVRAAQPHLADRRCELLEVNSPGSDLPRLTAALAKRPTLVVDGLFGIGLNRPLDQDWIQYIQTLNASALRVLAVDVPSGLNADTGANFGAVVGAETTLTVGAPKQGLLCSTAAESVGRLEVVTHVGLARCPCTGGLNWIMPSDFAGWPPRRAAQAHKGSFGHVLVVAGSVGYHGAAVLATRGAQRAQPGLVTLVTLPGVYTPVAAQLQAAMVRPLAEGEAFKPTQCSAALIGPGLAAAELPRELIAFARRLWREAAHPVVVDASALDWLEPGERPRSALRILTPHPGEAARLLGCEPAQVQADRPQALRQLSRRFGNAWVVLKGQHTLIGRSEGEILVNSTGNPQLAQGGSGDVLAGFIAGWLAQPAAQREPGRALAFAVWHHGAAADALSSRQPNWTIEDLADAIGNVRLD